MSSEFRTEAEFQKALQRLNAFCRTAEWQLTKARTRHVDEFGVEIDEGEHYYKKAYPWSPAATEKLSRASMEKVLFLIVASEPEVEQIADVLISRRTEGLQQAIQVLEPDRRR